MCTKAHDPHASVPTDGYNRYLKGEFVAMDTNNDGMLSLQQFDKLLTFLGYDGEMSTDAILHKVNTHSHEYVTIDEYYKTMKEFTDVKTRTNRLRVLFFKFDHSYDGFAPKVDVLDELRKMGVNVDDEIIAKVEQMDVNHDGKISYQEFVVTHLKQKQYI